MNLPKAPPPVAPPKAKSPPVAGEPPPPEAFHSSLAYHNATVSQWSKSSEPNPHPPPRPSVLPYSSYRSRLSAERYALHSGSGSSSGRSSTADNEIVSSED